MNTKLKVALAMLASAALGAAAVQGLHAQAKPKAFYVVEIEVLDAAAQAEYGPRIQATQRNAGGRPFRTAGEKVVGFVGAAPKAVAISEWDSMEQLEKYRDSPAVQALAPQRDKAIRIVHSYAVEAPAN